ncbi:hypothetical protein COW99_02535 [Candidatus Roizmanbacteria bacterium CG22_combo_CG10-13_8_21_14_all_38_20]|uniref:Membrane protein 6-pyruvoyl-tetrahydropterin synthase-related domain-containing protein n=1 Tax=Candidatus Roizmanbacteria bacterium CG22_combo_CG10-13_8_21_14_all_38_20 TaxID=1974862 RepID=A0A2H0BVL9_9BACT|nr:YfhO family protein [Candidatus Microgenomates bacterium]PIP61733.1 MAG: hypothetical protein COW99_02535 [Candidatus Roizmanbacteria bacterium CG22_combo_CG10-13_8_21_14_all_38_20]PJC32040.1 MAG: hypothetical protein CO050_00920 [Candidatus Roizmanbacteria bacterium CG_4_9_14_0_2_um_filter_38_17]
MVRKEIILALFLFGGLAAIFFYKLIALGLVPFPGDLLIAEYNPWRRYSFLGYVPGSFPTKFQYFDTLKQLYPWKTFVVDQLKQGAIPLWNPHNFSGQPLLANFQSAVFYPLNIFYFIFPQLSAWSLLVMLQPLLANWFMYLYARKVGLKVTGAVLASLSFAYSQFAIVWLEYNTIIQVMLWLPLLLLAVEHLLQKMTIRWMFLFVLGIISALFAGHIQVLGYVLSFVLIYSIYRAKLLHKIRRFWFIAWFIVLSVGIGAVQLLPGIELIGLSARSILEYNFLVDKILVQPYQLLMLFIPDIYGNPATANYVISDTYIGKALSIGFVAILFVLVSFSQIRKSHLVRLYAVVALVIGIMLTANPLSRIIYMLPLPLISSSSPTLMGFILAFSLSILAGMGLDHWQKKHYRYVVPAILIVGVAWLLYFSDVLPINRSSVILTSLLLVASLPLLYISTLKGKIAYLGIYALIFLQFSERWYSFRKFNSFVPKEVVYPDTEIVDFLKVNAGIDRVWGYGSAAIDANFATQLKLYSPEGYDPLYPQRYGEFIALTKQGKLQQKFDRTNRTDAVIATAYSLEDLKENEYRLKVLDVLGVKYILDRIDNPSYVSEFPSYRLEQVYDIDGWKIFVNKMAVPRLQLVFDYLVFNSATEFEQLFFSEDYSPRETVLLEQDLDLDFSCEDKQYNLELLDYLANEVAVQLDTNCEAILVLSDNYYPGWNAYIDGEKTKIYRANYTFRAVVVPGGSHEIYFKYEPDSFRYGVIISIASVLIMGVTIIMIKRREK